MSPLLHALDWDGDRITSVLLAIHAAHGHASKEYSDRVARMSESALIDENVRDISSWKTPEERKADEEARAARLGEPPPLSRRLHYLRGWSDGKKNEIFSLGTGTGGAAGGRCRSRARLDARPRPCAAGSGEWRLTTPPYHDRALIVSASS